MDHFPKIIAKLFFLTALLAHFFLIAIFFAPPSFLVAQVYEDLPLLSQEIIPESIKNLLNQKNILLAPVPDSKITLKDKLFLSILEVRRDHFMEEEEKLIFDLTVLDFGPGVVGMEAASEYYYQKPLSEISEEEWMNLISLHQIFLN